MTSVATETFGKGGAGNARPSTEVQHAPEPVTERMPPDNATGRGGYANLGTGPGHYDASGGHDVSESAGKGGYGNIAAAHALHGTTATGKPKAHNRRVSIIDVVIGSAMVTVGKATKNASLVEKGIARKTAPTEPAATAAAPATT